MGSTQKGAFFFSKPRSDLRTLWQGLCILPGAIFIHGRCCLISAPHICEGDRSPRMR